MGHGRSGETWWRLPSRSKGEIAVTASTVQEIADGFAARVTERLDESRLDGQVRLDPTRSIVIIPLKGKGPIHAYTGRQIDERGLEQVIGQLRAVPSLKGLVKEA